MDLALKALADPTRRAILRLVGDNELTAGDIASHFDCSRPAVSKHLRVLAEADLVSVRQEGTRRWYRARPESLAEARAWIDEMWAIHLAELKAAAEREEWPDRARKQSRARTAARRQGVGLQPEAGRRGRKSGR